jgi:hypothetical protein
MIGYPESAKTMGSPEHTKKKGGVKTPPTYYRRTDEQDSYRLNP